MRRVAAVVLAALIAASPAAAQDMGWSTITPSVTGTDTLGLVLREKVQQRAPSRRAAPDRAPAEVTPRPASFLYTPSKARRTANLAGFVAKSRAADPKGADDLAKLFASRDIIEDMRAPLSKYGMRIDNVADAYAVWWINAYQATRGTTDDPSPAATEAVRTQVMQSMGATREFVGAGDADKQELAESLLIQALLISTAVEQAKGNPDQLRAVGRAAAQGARGMGLDLSTMELTDAGFMPARAGAAEPSANGERVEVAEAKTGSSLPSYALIAAVGGAGIGGALLLGRRARG